VKVTSRSKRAHIIFGLNNKLETEAYNLHVSSSQIFIRAAQPAGFFYALQTLKQMMPAEVMAEKMGQGVKDIKIPAVYINDKPRFGWRGFMLDEGRHFFGKEEVKRVLDIMATYKMNRFHWHLTEDQGWRFEVPKYPKLTEIGAWRNSKVLGWAETKPDGQRYGGFYTKKDIQEIVEYAKARYIEIMPEVDIPGHSQAAVAAYPQELACDPQSPHEVWLWQGVSADVINVANPAAVQFAKDVVDELIELFPFGYIHLGGDECPTSKWERNTDCQNLLKQLGSTNYRDLQTHFYKQLQEYIAQKPAKDQRQLVFWNEVLHGNTTYLDKDNTTIMAWIGADGAALDAAKRSMSTILSPQIPYYINRKQSTEAGEPRSQGHGHETVKAVYNYQPAKGVASELLPNYKGVQANFWTEWVEESWVVEYLMLPRLAAVAEAGWTPQDLRNYDDFESRVKQHKGLYELRGWSYGKHIWK
ncbi:MAG: beta-N-acetylhexosaminidase, partial [Paraprevotella sp.]|nr:beta-N-acetylhexosaminidase [Paraprevotella sp.]